jgi:flagellar export protein FliJ
MAFEFPLQPVLRLRQSLEERERLRLAMVIAAINQLHLHCERLEQQTVEAGRSLCEKLKTGMAAGEVELIRTIMSSFRRRKEALLQRIAALQQQRSQQQQAFRDAQRKRKIIEKLREVELEAYRRDQARREQQLLDDQFGQRRARPK